MTLFDGFVLHTMNTLVTLFVFLIGVGVFVLILMYIADVCQKRDAIRRNYPVVGRFRNLFSNLGEFFRQYFFAMDREE
ncbi:MAG: FMN-binding glutamate synthase family protein, partial [Alphaproteobacteria bacterium]|nr:FMN-binding glutamate synthase family protein [Alphaproteobacteria bacterium]